VFLDRLEEDSELGGRPYLQVLRRLALGPLGAFDRVVGDQLIDLDGVVEGL
jgi:hypothetical protein